MATNYLLLLALLALVPVCQARIQRLESTTWHPSSVQGQQAATGAAAGDRHATCHEQDMARSLQLLRTHPAVHTLQDLGIWQTQHFGRLPASAAASAAAAALPREAGVLRRLAAGAWAAAKASVPHGGAPAVLLTHWWRLRCLGGQQQQGDAGSSGSSGRSVSSSSDGSSASSMHLRGLGTATVSLDWVYHHALTPRLPESTTAITITDVSSSSSSSRSGSSSAPHSWTLPQSEVTPGIPSGWHVEARGLSPGRLYRLTSSQALSQHSHSLDASQCSNGAAAGAAAAAAAAAGTGAAAGAGLAPGSVWAVLTASEPYQDMDLYARLLVQHTEYHQQLGFNGSILLLTRPVAAQLIAHPALQPGLKAGAYFIILWDGDVVPGTPYYHQSLWHNLVLLATWGIPDIRLAFIDLDEYYVLPRHRSFQEAFAPAGCLQGLAQARLMRHSAYYGLTAAQAASCPDSRFFHKACQPQPAQGDGATLARLGWRGFFQQEAGYVDARPTIPDSPWWIPHRWAHKSVVDPNHVAAYSIHEAGLLLPGGGRDSQHAVPLQCAFGLHLVNMMGPRLYGNGQELALNGSRFDMAAYVATLAERQQQQQRQRGGDTDH